METDVNDTAIVASSEVSNTVTIIEENASLIPNTNNSDITNHSPTSTPSSSSEHSNSSQSLESRVHDEKERLEETSSSQPYTKSRVELSDNHTVTRLHFHPQFKGSSRFGVV